MAIAVTIYHYEAQHSGGRADRLPEHRAWLRENITKGVIIESGVLDDDAGAILLLHVEDVNQAHKVLVHDPYAQAGFLGAVDVLMWTPKWCALAEAQGTRHPESIVSGAEADSSSIRSHSA